MFDRRLILAPVFLLAQALAVQWATGQERQPAPPTLSNFPQAFGEWRLLREDPIAADVEAQLRADQLLSRTYLNASNGAGAGLFVAWFRSQRAGSGQPHSPQVCLPAAGWTPAVTGELTINTAAGAITVNRYIVVNRAQRLVVLYWFQDSRRVTAGEWAAKFWVVAGALTNHRTDTALVRVVASSGNGADRAATAQAADFARNLYPLLRENLPK